MKPEAIRGCCDENDLAKDTEKMAVSEAVLSLAPHLFLKSGWRPGCVQPYDTLFL